jgi:hypothetical protein
MDPKYQDGVGSTEAMFESEEPATLDVVVGVKIEAECWRVYSACSIPEYMEAWLDVPEGTTIDFCNDLGSQNRISVTLRLSYESKRIYSSRLRTKPDRITFLWKSVEPNSVNTSVVEILLKGGPRRCTLRLRHGGLRNWDEKDLYSKMWLQSLMKLQSLMRSTYQLHSN